MLLSQEPVNLYMTFALISFGVTSLSEKYCPILKDLNTTLVFTFKSFPILHIFSLNCQTHVQNMGQPTPHIHFHLQPFLLVSH